mmetsp:Transcript_6988/g.10240  ORF Transcript_6988/g.10240 Transcript_6988/m.10240 type:complete len:781 (+) Transcript_6988:340-2682(+)
MKNEEEETKKYNEKIDKTQKETQEEEENEKIIIKKKKRSHRGKKRTRTKKRNRPPTKFKEYWTEEKIKNEERIVIGKVSISNKNSTFGYTIVLPEYNKEWGIEIPEDLLNVDYDVIVRNLEDRNRALHGDIVVMKLNEREKYKKRKRSYTNEEGKVEETVFDQPTGKVVKIIKEGHKTKICGTLVEAEEEGHHKLVPFDMRYPKLLIPNNQINMEGGIWKKKVYIARIVEWSKESKYPLGYVKKTFDREWQSPSSIINIIKNEKEIKYSRYPKAVAEAAEERRKKIIQMPTTKRRDCRKLNVFTIDPKGSKDLDDAFSVTYKDSKKEIVEIGIHIADVGEYVREDDELDKEVQKRTTTVYLIHEILHMLPEKMSNDICSLIPNQDRLAVSMFVTMDMNGNIIEKPKFEETIINSKQKLSYEEADEIMEGTKANYPEWMKDNLETLNILGKLMRAKREGLNVHHQSPMSVQYVNNEKLEMYVRKNSNSHELVEEWMIVTNHYAASFLKDNTTLGIMRIHRPPEAADIENFFKIIAEFGLQKETAAHKPLQQVTTKELNEILSHVAEMDNELIQDYLEYNMKKLQTPAKYYCWRSENGDKEDHFGLNLQAYTHFTSPIRRYPDVIVHRMIKQIINPEENWFEWNYTQLRSHLENCNKMRSRASSAEEDARIALIRRLSTDLSEDEERHEFKALVKLISKKGNVHLYVPLLQVETEMHVKQDCLENITELDKQKRLVTFNFEQGSTQIQRGDSLKVALAPFNPKWAKKMFELEVLPFETFKKK